MSTADASKHSVREELAVSTVLFFLVRTGDARVGWGRRIDTAIARLHPRTRVAVVCKRASTALNIHLTFPPGYTRRWRTSIPKIKGDPPLVRKRAKKFARKSYSVVTSSQVEKSSSMKKRKRHVKSDPVLSAYREHNIHAVMDASHTHARTHICKITHM